MSTRPPNILLLMSDEHRADVLGFAGNPIIRTPTLDRIAAEGVVFDAAYTPSPICVPARQCMAAGQYPSTCGVRRYGEDLPPFSMTFARWLGEHDYLTVACGKLHHMGIDQMQGWHRRIGMDHMLRPEKRPPTESGLAQKWSDAKEVRRAGIGRGPHTHAWDEYALDGCLRFIDELFVDAHYDKAVPDRPLLLYVGFNNPHYPYLADEERFSYYLNRVEPYLHQEPFDHPLLGCTINREPGFRHVPVGPGGCVTERDVRRATAAYYANIELVDTQYATVLEALERSGQNLDDWLIVFSSDHGEMLGQHGIWEKQKFFEASVRIPLIMRWPGRLSPRAVSQNVSLCDLFASFCDAAGLPTPPPDRCVNGRPLDSRSLLPLAAGTASAWDDTAIAELNGTDLMIKRGSLKYQRYDRPECADEPEVLFDQDADPTESRNLAPERPAEIAEFRRLAHDRDAGR